MPSACLQRLSLCLPCRGGGTVPTSASASASASSASWRGGGTVQPTVSRKRTLFEALSFYTARSQSFSSGRDSPSDLLEPTPEQRERCRSLLERAEGEGACDGIPGGARWYEEAELLRYVCARPTVDQSLSLFREAMTWRRKHAREWSDGAVREGSYGGEYPSAGTGGQAVPPWLSFLRDRMPLQVYEEDQYGLPILYFSLGRVDFPGLKREVGIERLRQFVVYCNDYFLDASRRFSLGGQGHIIHGHVQIVDCDGLSFWDVKDIQSVGKEITAGINCLHPERVRKTFVVRAPKAFSILWGFATKFLDPRTVERTKIFSATDSLDALLLEVGGPCGVPAFLPGGECHDVRGPREDKRIESGAFERHRAAVAAAAGLAPEGGPADIVQSPEGPDLVAP